jgi:hypothetical protein
MKKIVLIIALLAGAYSYKADAQVRVNINIGRQPVWGPAGYDYVDYYYLPDYDVYYDVPRGMFVYFDLGRWNFAATLPPRYGHYDLYHSYKVVINSRDPWLRNSYYRSQYARYRGHYQPVIRDSRDGRYYAARQRYEQERYNDRREDRGNYGRDNGRGNGGWNNGRGNGGEHGRGHGNDRDHGNEHGRGHHGDHD